MSTNNRLWFRFQFWTLLIAIALVAISLAWIAKERWQSQYEAQVAQQLREQGFTKIILGGPYDSWDPLSKKISQGWWRNIARKIYGERIISIAIAPPGFDDVSLLEGLTNVQWLHLHGTKVSDLTLVAGPGYRNLVGLDAGNSLVSDLTPLAGLHKLRGLTLNDTKVNDVRPLAGLVNLNGLRLQSTQVRDLTPLTGLTNLTALDLRYTPTTKEQVEALQEFLHCRIRYDPNR